MSRLLFVALLAISLGCVAPSSNHLPAGLAVDLGPGVNLNERFFDQVRALIKRRLQEKGLAKPEQSDLPLPLADDDALALQNQRSYDNVPLPAASVPTPVLVENWPTEQQQHSFGQVTAVAVDPQGNPVVFHRAERYWDVNTFNESNIYYLIEYGPIKENTIYVLDAKTGAIKSGWGSSMFYMPHGMTIDGHGNYWITDVAMHQAFKFKPFSNKPLLTIGKRFRPGSSVKHLCKPTSIAVATTGEFFIADGYCNSRILKFNAAGKLLRTIPQPPEFLSLQVPHAITLLEHLDLLCIADRENMRVVCPKAGLISSHGEGEPAATIQEPDLGRVFGVASYGDIVFAVNGPTSMLPVRGFTIDPRSETIIGHWGEFKNPHSMAVSVNGSALYVTEIGTNHQTNRVWKYVLA
ncbi:peptidyl-alpha-hydroxyglycine alpha-amidating lyase 2 [Drosophila elegans]|uniref:peptidyl-alpha-hydroxyglycine alpha-amidating lyase 2 n=1 Tax=Drosophila elegans TaxID=30023 RepID=UPI0007E86660|nr:peptidyl-alpha-hydroxyglycine alpha-amidating lyase 2 [Drosophila elegans]